MKKIVIGQEVADWVGKKLDMRSAFVSAIGLKEDGRIIAGVLYDYYNGPSVNMHIAAEGKRWLNRAFLHFCFWYPFEQLGVKRINGLVPENNMAARKFDEHLGFKLEHRIVDGAPDGDMLLYGMLRKECKWLYLTKVMYREAA